MFCRITLSTFEFAEYHLGQLKAKIAKLRTQNAGASKRLMQQKSDMEGRGAKSAIRNQVSRQLDQDLVRELTHVADDLQNQVMRRSSRPRKGNSQLKELFGAKVINNRLSSLIAFLFPL